MLKQIPSNLTPDLLKILMEMGHGDEIIIADGNFPAASHAQRLLRLDGQSIPEVLSSVMKFLPLDTYVKSPVTYMGTPEGEREPEIWATYKKIIVASDEKMGSIEKVDRFEFYTRAKKAYAIIATSETALYANIILKKGVIT